MKTVHLISGGDAGGARTHVLRLLGELNKTGQAHLFALGGGALADDARERGIPCETLTGGFFAQLRAAKRYIRSGGFDLVRCHGSRANLTAALLRPSLGVPVVSTIHSDHRLDYLHRPAARLVYGTLNALALRKMDALVCVSGAMREKYAARNFRRGRLFSVYNGADMDAPRSKMRREDFLAAHGIPAAPGDILAGTAARFDAVKDLSTMLRGFAAAAKEEPQLRLLLAGAGAEEEMLRALAKELGVSDRVHFTGWLDDTEALYASLDICLLTSLSETFPYALTDAAKYRVPVIATAVGGVPELVENGVHGLLIAPGDTAALASDILTLSRDPALREKLGTALRDRTAKEFSLSAMALREKEICRAVLSPRREIVIAGAYGCGNRGDELMLENLLRDGRAAAPECAVTVLSHRPKETARRFDADSLYYLNVPAIRRRMKSARALVFGGGNLLQDATSRRSLAYYLALLRKGKQSGCRTLLYGAGLGPLSPRGWAKCTAALNKCADTLVFRERESLAAAREHGINAPELILGADGAGETSVSAAPRENVLFVCPRRGRGAPPFPTEYARAAAEIAAKRGWKLRYIAMNVRQDLPLCRALVSETGGEAAAAPEDTVALARLFASARLTVSMRLHALTLSYLAGTPAFGIDGDGRIAAFAKECGIPYRAVEECGDIAVALEEALTAETPDAAIWNERLAAGRAALARALRAPEKEKEK
ncbi:MAG: glycosyltransferase [Christensenellaceae bacterium]